MPKICNCEFWKNYFAYLEKHFEEFTDKQICDKFSFYLLHSQKVNKLENNLREKIKLRIKKYLEEEKNVRSKNYLHIFISIFLSNFNSEKYLAFNMLLINNEKDHFHFYESLEFLEKHLKQLKGCSHKTLINNVFEYMNQLQFWARSETEGDLNLLYKKDEPENKKYKILFGKIWKKVCKEFFKKVKKILKEIRNDPFLFSSAADSHECPKHWALMIYFLKLDGYIFHLYQGIQILSYDKELEFSCAKQNQNEFNVNYKIYLEMGEIYAYHKDFYKKKHEKELKEMILSMKNFLFKKLKKNGSSLI